MSKAEQEAIKKFRKVAVSVRQFSPLLQMVETGMSPEEMKQAVIEELEPFFNNRDVLLKLALPALVPEAVNLARLQSDPWAFDMYQRCLDAHRSAQAIAGGDSLRACALWEPAVAHGLSEYWSAVYLEVTKDDLPLEEFKHEIFRNLGMVIEAAMQPHLRELLHQTRLKEHVPDPEARLDTMSLGDVVGELIDRSGFPELFEPPPWHIRLNQWRNIAQHYSSRIEGNTIICSYGREPRIHEIRLSRSELLIATRRVFNAFPAMRVARTIFFVDNIQVARTFLPEVNVPLEAQILNFASAAATQGFEVIDIRLTEEEANAVLRDASNLDPGQRRMHASQFVYQLWVHTKRPRVKVEYQEKDGTRSLLTTAWAKDCKRISRGEIEFCELANLTEMVDLKLGIIVPRHKHSEEAPPHGNAS